MFHKYIEPSPVFPIISYRQVSKSDGTSVVEINIRYSTNAGGLKYQKIHFTEGDK